MVARRLRGGRAPLPLSPDPTRVVDLLERLVERRAVDRDHAVVALVEAVVAGERVDVSVKDEPDRLAVPVDDGGAGIAPDDVVGRHEVEGGRELELRLP